MWWQLIRSCSSTGSPIHSLSWRTTRSIISSRLSSANCCAHRSSRDVPPELRRALHQVGEVGVGQLDPPLRPQPLRDLDVMLAILLPTPRDAGVQEQPHRVRLVDRHLDEVVAEPSEPSCSAPVARVRGRVEPGFARRAPRAPRPAARRSRRPCGCRRPPTAARRARSAPAARRRSAGEVAMPVNCVRTAIMPQPMSTPTAAGMIAPSVGMTDPTVAPMPRWASGISARCG